MKAKLYMKSGNEIIITNIDDIIVSWKGNEISGIEVKWSKDAPKSGVMIGTIALDQIEAIETM